MPRIQTYEAGQVGTPGPVGQRRAVAEDFGGGALAAEVGRNLGSLSDLLAQREERADVSNISAQLANAQAEQAAHLQELLRTADPADPNVADRFLEQFDEYTGKLSEQVKTRAGREYFQKTVGTLRGYFLGRALEGQAELAGVKAKQDYEVILNQQSSALINDPSAFQLTLGLHHESVDNLVTAGGLSRAVAEQLKTDGATELAKSAVLGMINVNPEAAKEVLASGEFDSFIHGTLKQQLDGQADQAIEAQRIEAERARAAAERAKQQAQMTAQNDLLVKLANGELTTQDVLASNLDPFGEGGKATFLRMIEAQTESGGNIKTDANTFIQLWDRIHLPEGDPNKLTDENALNQFLGRGLTVENINTLRTEMQGSRTTDGLIEDQLKDGLIQTAKSALTGTDPLLGLRDPKGDEQLQKFMAWFLPEYKRLREQGKSPIELLDPESPDYLGKAISRWQRSRSQFLKDLIDNNPGTLGLGGAGGTTEADLAARATRTATGEGGRKIYEVDGAWVYGDGSKVE